MAISKHLAAALAGGLSTLCAWGAQADVVTYSGTMAAPWEDQMGLFGAPANPIDPMAVTAQFIFDPTSFSSGLYFFDTAQIDITIGSGEYKTTATMNHGHGVYDPTGISSGGTPSLNLGYYDPGGSFPTETLQTLDIGVTAQGVLSFGASSIVETLFVIGPGMDGVSSYSEADTGFSARNGAYAFSANDPAPSVPEPAAWSLMLAGFAGMGPTLRARRRAPAA